MTCRYVSTRGQAPALGFADVLLSGPAPDGGLYVPEPLPPLPPLPDPAGGRFYRELAAAVMAPFVAGAVPADRLAAMVGEACDAFDEPDVCKLTALDDDHYLLELFHGPTLAFKDVALQLVGRLFDHELGVRDRRAVIVGATSGDTGSSAMEAVRDRDRIDIVMLHPHGRTSEIQRRQMTTLDAPNVWAVAIDGTFDDCQDLVKAMFADEALRAEADLAAVNSINWARVMAQVVYYVWAWLRLGGERAPTFCVPTGNFGNVYAGHVARRMGLPVGRLIAASNRNDVISRFVATGELAARPVEASLSPSMDIQISSNLERLLYELLDGDGEATGELVSQFRQQGRAGLDPDRHRRLRSALDGDRLSDPETLEAMRRVWETSGVLVDPHTAVGVGVAERRRRPGELMVTLATAHPAKFPEAVAAAIGAAPEPPPALAGLADRPERCVRLPNNLAAVAELVRSVSRR